MKRASILSQLIVTLMFLALISLPVSAEETSDQVNINQASADILAERMNGVGPQKAQAIVDFREAEGDFVTVEHLEEVRGIGLATIENNRDKLTVD